MIEPPTALEPNESNETNILDLAFYHGLSIRTDCGGKGLCGKCKVIVIPPENLSPVTELERKVLSSTDLAQGVRLACQAIAKGKVSVSVPVDSSDTPEANAKTDLEGNFPVDPMVRRLFIDPRPNLNTEHRDFVSILRKVDPSLNNDEFWDPVILRDLSAHWTEKGSITLVKHRKRGVTGVLPGSSQSMSLGFAVDIGTTTVAAYLCDMVTGNVLGASSCANPQRRYGEDVISRIAFSGKNEDGTRTLKDLIIEGINTLFGECLSNCGAKSCDVDEVALVGNTTMQHLFCGVNPRSLGGAPYLPVSREAADWRASDLGLNLNPCVNVHTFPVISGFLGGDTVGAILWDETNRRDETTLLVDIGTNGELVLAKGAELWATSCATGPAFEGAHISSGMRAVDGAINRIRIDSTDFNVSYDVIRHEAISFPRGLCGSGVIDAVAEMRKVGLIRQNGRLNEAIPGVICDSKGIGRRFTLVTSDETGTGSSIDLTLDDIREVQLAKTALNLGIKYLMASADVKQVDRLVLTGAFGARFDWKNAAAIGMLPVSCVSGAVEIVANAAGLGAVLALLDSKSRKRAAALAQEVRVLELSEHPDFHTEFPFGVDFPPVAREL